MNFSKWVFRIAGIYGLIVMTPQYLLEQKIGLDTPPAITHPEYFYGFIGVVIAWQIVFLLISSDPVKFRVLMIPAMLEKLAFGVPAIVLYYFDRVIAPVLFFGCLDLVLCALFAVSYLRTKSLPHI
jgi:hypothetical protein